jgi:hypothetical protein
MSRWCSITRKPQRQRIKSSCTFQADGAGLCARHLPRERGRGSVHNKGEDEVAYTGGWRDLVTGIVEILLAIIAGHLHPVRALHLVRFHRDRHCCSLTLVALKPLWLLPRRLIRHRVVVVDLPSLPPFSRPSQPLPCRVLAHDTLALHLPQPPPFSFTHDHDS